MNFLSHAVPYLDQPVIAVATGIPDWLSVVDRRIRARGRAAAIHSNSDDDDLRCVARGILRHIEDDRWFHTTEAFVSTNLQMAVELREWLPGDAGFRPTFVSHILIEMLLDSFWIEDDSSTVERYYAAIEEAGYATIQRCVNTITGRPTERLADVMERFVESRFLYDYLDHDRLLYRLNQVMNRVGLTPLPGELLDWLPEARKLVESRRRALLTAPDEPTSYSTFPSPSRETNSDEIRNESPALDR